MSLPLVDEDERIDWRYNRPSPIFKSSLRDRGRKRSGLAENEIKL